MKTLLVRAGEVDAFVPSSPQRVERRETDLDALQFLLDRDVNEWVARAMQRAGKHPVRLPAGMTDTRAVLAEAKRQRRVLVTHEPFMDARRTRCEGSPGIVVLPRNRPGRLDWPIITAIVSEVARRAIDQSVFCIRSNGTFTVWTPSAYTDVMDETHGRISSDRMVELSLEDFGY